MGLLSCIAFSPTGHAGPTEGHLRQTFIISFVRADTGNNSTFMLASGALAQVALDADTGLGIGLLSGGSLTITTTDVIAAGTSKTVSIVGTLGAFALSEFRLTTGLIVPPNANATSTNNSAAVMNLSGLGVAHTFTGLCVQL